MPQVTPAQLQEQVNAPAPYGTGKPQNNIPLQQKLFELFKPSEFVTIMNIDDEPLYWQYMPIEGEEATFSEDGTQRMISRTQPEMWVIAPGETEVIVGESAYRALDTLYKNVMAKSTLQRFNDPTSPMFDEKGKHLPKNFNFADSGAQDAFIEKAYLGKAVPTFGNAQPVAAIPSAPPVAAPVTPEPAPAPQPQTEKVEYANPEPASTGQKSRA